MALLDLHLARSFVALVDAGSFTGGALALGISQPTVSQHVRRLEELTGERLLLRDTHAVRMTADGAVVYRLAREMIALDEQARAYFNGSADRSRIRLGVSEDLALTRLPIMLRQLAGGAAACADRADRRADQHALSSSGRRAARPAAGQASAG